MTTPKPSEQEVENALRCVEGGGCPDWPICLHDHKIAAEVRRLRCTPSTPCGGRDCPSDKPSTRDEALTERTAQLIAHRVCCGTEHDPLNGKLHGYCVVCGVCWPCQYAGTPPSLPAPVYNLVNTTPSTGDGGSVNTPTPAQQER